VERRSGGIVRRECDGATLHEKSWHRPVKVMATSGGVEERTGVEAGEGRRKREGIG
jgi:hypothetical protein